jgi:branched-chain amino acid transport system substrate-binding protein
VSRRALRAVSPVVAAASVLAMVLAGCGSGDQALPNNKIRGHKLTIWVSVPLNGLSAVSGDAVFRGADLALQAIGARIGRYRIVLNQLDDSQSTTDEWNAGQTASDASIAVNDPTTIGYVGDFNSGASAVSIPVLNAAGIPQVSPSATAVGLTSGGAGANPGEPEAYYPTRTRTFARVVPGDLVQAKVQIAIQRQAGCRSTYVIEDLREYDGDASGGAFQDEAQVQGLRIAGGQPYDPTATSYAGLGQAVVQSGADCVLIAAIPDANAVAVAEQIAAAVPHAQLFATSGLAESTFVNPALGGIPLSLDHRLLITFAGGDPRHPDAAATTFYRNYEAQFGPPEPVAIDGYAAMSLLLGAIRRATDGGRRTAERSKVVAALFHAHVAGSVVGNYSIDANGDTSIDSYGVYRVIDGELRFWRSVVG